MKAAAMQRRLILPLMASLMLAAGCRPRAAPPPPAPSVYTGPLLSAQQVVLSLHQRSIPLRTLWARHDFVVSVRDASGKVRTIDGDGTLQLRKPRPGSDAPTELRLKGNKDVLGEVFDLGVNRDRAWLTLHGEIDTMWWLPAGAELPAGVEAEDGGGVPVRPDLVPEVLGLQDWASDLTRFPAPVVTFDPARDAYRVVVVEPAKNVGGGLVSRREVYVDRATQEIRRVVLFAADGRPVVESELTNWLAVQNREGAEIGRAPGSVVLFLPLSRATMRFSLRDPVASRNNFPNDASFRFPATPPVGNVVPLAPAPTPPPTP